MPLNGPVDIGVDQFVDTDGDEMPDWWEIGNDLDPSVNDANVASGDEGETNLQTYNDYATQTTMEDLTAEPPPEAIIQDDTYKLAADGSGIDVKGSWAEASGPGESGTTYLIATGSGSGEVDFIPNIPATGSYEVFMQWPYGAGSRANFNTKTEVEVDGLPGVSTFTVDQSRQSNKWNSLGVFAFSKGVGSSSGRVVIRRPAVSGTASGAAAPVVADAVRFVPVPMNATLTAVGTNTEGTVTFTPRAKWSKVDLSAKSGATARAVRTSKTPAATVAFVPNLRVPGFYKVSLRWQRVGLSGTNGDAPNVQVDVVSAEGPFQTFINEQSPSLCGQWVQISNTNTTLEPLEGA